MVPSCTSAILCRVLVHRSSQPTRRSRTGFSPTPTPSLRPVQIFRNTPCTQSADYSISSHDAIYSTHHIRPMPNAILPAGPRIRNARTCPVPRARRSETISCMSCTTRQGSFSYTSRPASVAWGIFLPRRISIVHESGGPFVSERLEGEGCHRCEWQDGGGMGTRLP